MTFLNLILVRHGKTRHNLEEKAIGLNQIGLDYSGCLQAMSATEAITSLATVALYISPTTKALETSTIISQRLGI